MSTDYNILLELERNTKAVQENTKVLQEIHKMLHRSSYFTPAAIQPSDEETWGRGMREGWYVNGVFQSQPPEKPRLRNDGTDGSWAGD